LQWLSFDCVWFPSQFQTKGQIGYARKTKRHDIYTYILYIFNYCTISSAGSLVASNIFTLGRTLQLSADHHARWPPYKLWRTSFLGPRPRLFPSPAWQLFPPKPQVDPPYKLRNESFFISWEHICSTLLLFWSLYYFARKTHC